VESEIERQFAEIAEDMLARSEDVECTMQNFLIGLRSIESTLKFRIAQIESELGLLKPW
jgi:hypothetical protein